MRVQFFNMDRQSQQRALLQQHNDQNNSSGNENEDDEDQFFSTKRRAKHTNAYVRGDQQQPMQDLSLEFDDDQEEPDDEYEFKASGSREYEPKMSTFSLMGELDSTLIQNLEQPHDDTDQQEESIIQQNIVYANQPLYWELSQDQWVPNDKVKQCWRCQKNFTIFLWKKHCLMCGKVTCSKCTVDRVFDIDGTRMCNDKAIKARQAELKQKLRKVLVCLDCDSEFEQFQNGCKQLSGLNLLLSASSVWNQEEQKSKGSHITTEMRQTAKLGFDLNIDELNFEETRTEKSQRQSIACNNMVQTIQQEETQGKKQPGYKDLVEFQRRHISKVVAIQLLTSQLDLNKWHERVFNFMVKAAEKVRPSCQVLQDQMDFNKYVKIKIVEWKDSSLTKYIHGTVITKNLQDKAMKTQLEKPRIMVLTRLEIPESNNIQNEIFQEDGLIEILSQRLAKFEPDLLFVEKEIPFKVLQMIQKNHQNINVVSSLSENQINKIARVTQTVTATEISKLDKGFVLGQCQSFEVSNHSKLAKENQVKLQKENQFFMTIESLMPALGCTIVLSGPQSEFNELRALKVCMKNCLPLIKNLVYERAYLSMLNIEVPKVPKLNPMEAKMSQFQNFIGRFKDTDAQTPFLVTQQLENRQLLNFKEFQIALNTKDYRTVQSDISKIKEKFVRENIDKICQNDSRCKRVGFYQQAQPGEAYDEHEHDIQIGTYISQMMSSRVGVQCESCNLQLTQHVIELYHGDGHIQIQIKNEQSRDTINEFQYVTGVSQKQDTKSVTFCLKCKFCSNTTTPVPLPTQVFEYSTARFFEQLFYNRKKYKLRGPQVCECRSETSNVLATNFLFVFNVDKLATIQFSYHANDIYQIQVVQPNKYQNESYIKKLRNEKTEKIEQTVQKIIQVFKTNIQGIKSQIFDVQQYHKHMKLAQDPSLELLSKQLAVLDQIFIKFDKSLNSMLNEILMSLSSVSQDIFGTQFINKKLKVSLGSFQRVLKEITRCTSVVIVLMRRKIQSAIFSRDEEQKLDSSVNTQATTVDTSRSSDKSRTFRGSNTSQLGAGLSEQIKTRYPCFVEDFYDYSETLFQQDDDSNESMSNITLNETRVFQYSCCPVSGRDSKCCDSTQKIVECYEGLCELIQDKFMELEEEQPIEFDFDESEQSELAQSWRVQPKLGQSAYLTKEDESNQSLMVVQKQQKKAYIGILKEDFISVALGVDNYCVEIELDDPGSVLAYGLKSNAYLEALCALDFVGLKSKVFPTPNLTPKPESFPIHIVLKQEEVGLDSDTVQEGLLVNELNSEIKNEWIQIKFSSQSQDISYKIHSEGKLDEESQSQFQFSTSTKQNKINDLHQLIFPKLALDYLGNLDCQDIIKDLEQVFLSIQQYYFADDVVKRFKQHTNDLTRRDDQMLIALLKKRIKQRQNTVQEADSDSDDQGDGRLIETGDLLFESFAIVGTKPRTESIQTKKAGKLHNTETNQEIINQFIEKNKKKLNLSIDDFSMPTRAQLNFFPNEIFKVLQPSKVYAIEQKKKDSALNEIFEGGKIDIQMKILFPKQFEALRRLYCGKQIEFISSILLVEPWATSGGKTMADFFKAHDQKYVLKLVNKKEFKMFIEFGPSYFQYMRNVVYNGYPSVIAKILAAYSIKTTRVGNERKVYVLVLENLNLGINPSDEKYIMRYDLKGSQVNRFVNKSEAKVHLDSNFLLSMNGRPILIDKKLSNLLHISLNNDSLCLANSNRIDYSLLAVVNRKDKWIRFGLIDYLQSYTIQRILESNFKKILNMGTRPTIIEPKDYRLRFIKFLQLYLIGVGVQKICEGAENSSVKELHKQLTQGHQEITQIYEERQEMEESNRDSSPKKRGPLNLQLVFDGCCGMPKRSP